MILNIILKVNLAWALITTSTETIPDRAGTVRVERHDRDQIVLVYPDGRRAKAEVTANAIAVISETGDDGQVLRALGLEPVRPLLRARRMWLVRDASGRRDGIQLAAELQRNPALASLTPDLRFPRRMHAMPVPPNDPQYGAQWYLKKVEVEKAWARTTGSPSVSVAVVDNGCDLTHEDLRDSLLPGIDVFEGDDDPSVPLQPNANNHGTACAGIVAATGNNALGIAGACPECKTRCVRLLNDSEIPIPVSSDVEAMAFALEHPDVAVVSNSWSFADNIPVPEPLAVAIEELATKGRGGLGTVIVFAAGNDNRTLRPDELYSLPGVLTVGAINNFDELAPFSNQGAAVALTAPTGSYTLDITGAAGESPGNYTQRFGGTSSSCPLVAGIAALLISAKPDATAREIFDVLRTTTRPAPYARPDATGHDPRYGFGIVDPAAALQKLVPEPVDAGTVDAGAMEPTPPPPSSCSCGAARGEPVFLLLGLLAWRARRKSGERHRAAPHN